MADKAVPELDRLIGYYQLRNGELIFETFTPEFSTLRFALIDLLRNPTVKEVFLSSGGIWFRLTLPELESLIRLP